MNAATIEIPQETWDYIVDQLNRKCSVDTVGQLLEMTLRATPEQAQQMVAEVIAAQSTAQAVIEQAFEPAQPESAQAPIAQPVGGGATAFTCDSAVASERLCARPFDGAQHVASKGVPQIPLRPGTKIAFQNNWDQLATTDPTQLNAWHAQYPDANWAGVALAQPGGIWIFEIDNADAVRQRLGSVKLPRTFMVRSRPGRGHYYFRHNAASIALAQVKDHISIKDDQGKEIASARVHHAYCVSAGSIHPDTQKPYEIVNDVDLIEAPEDLIDWIKSQHVVEKKLPVTASSDGPRVPRGSHDNELIRIAGKLRADGLEYDEIVPILVRIVEERFDDIDPGENIQTWCEAKAKSACRYAKGSSSIPMLHAGEPMELVQARIEQQKQMAQAAAAVAEETEPEIDDTGLTPRPVFPSWVMEGTSLYEHLVKPVVSTSSKFPELVFMPGVLMFMNAIALRVRLAAHRSVPNMFLGLISPYGKFYKSSSCEAAMDYFKKAGFAASYSMKVPSVLVTTLILSPGSPEGAALQMKRINGPKAVFYYDELGSFCAKASIEHSAMLDKMLSWYEAKEDGNQIKANQSSYHFESGKYCFSWLWCTTDRKLSSLWSKLTGSDSGLNNRMFFLLSPEEPRESGLYSEPEFDVTETNNRITRALIHRPIDGVATYDYDDLTDTAAKIKGLDPCSQSLFEHLAMYFAIDLGRDCIDVDCCERALKLVEYRNAVEAYLDLFQADTKEAAIPHEIIRELRRNRGKMKYRDLYHDLHAMDRLRAWNQSLALLRGEGLILIREPRNGKDARMVYLLKEKD